jgi:hypothetical protein
MCYSTTASFALGSALIIIGSTSVVLAAMSDKRWIPLALIPFFCGAQQCVEGLIWIDLLRGSTDNAHFHAYTYLFFVYIVWPVLTPVAAWMLEPDKLRRKILGVFIVTAIVSGAAIYLSLLLGYVVFITSIEHNAIFYYVNLPSSIIIIYSAFYLADIVVSLLLSSHTGIRNFGWLLLASLVITMWFYLVEFISVWCFFAAACSLYILAVIYRLPLKDPIISSQGNRTKAR